MAGHRNRLGGHHRDADNPVTPELLRWADLVFVMERIDRSNFRRSSTHLLGARIVCLDIPDDFDFMEPALVALLQARVSRHLPAS